ncbi:hypothetical protein JCM5353_006793 [Sporobolomyces roseus]
MSSSHPLFESHPYAQSYPTHLSPRLPPSVASFPDQHSPQFRPLPIDHSAPNTPPHAYTMSTDPMDSYSSYNNASIASPYKSSLGPSDPLSFPPPPINTAPKSRWKSFWATYNSANQLTFLTVFGVQAAAVLAMILLIYITIHNNIGDLRTSDLLAADPQLESVATYVSLFILAVVFELLVILDACQSKNIIGIVCIVIFQIAMLIYSSVLPRQLSDALDGSNADTPRVNHLVHIYSVVIPCVVGGCTLIFSYLTYRLYEEFGWDVFKRIGADIKIKKCYKLYQIFVALLKFDAFAFLGFEIQFLVLVTGTRTTEFVLTIVSLPIILIALALTAVVVRIESRIGVYVSLLCQAAGMAYFAYKLARIYSEQAGPRYATAQATLTIFSIISLLMLVATFVLTGLCMANFGKGLKERIPGYAFNGGKSFIPTSNAISSPQKQHGGYDDIKLSGRRPSDMQLLGSPNRRESEMGRSQTRMSID